ncbi:uncharacterized protein KY384_002128 [Bacidia gigantensis]|uniref:uncharacterized protein n=1 Tax=Bacidia gigantensis TaxID=2732470 RepID=UPI001D049A1A|nr:uncharacterized protein KY384_002128 [Bacidia gigantensis]KAG8533345.1 hypothetical protein KY384_002128 [Bacidia gigantensis]
MELAKISSGDHAKLGVDAVTSTIPTFSYISTTPNTTYTLLLIDLSINALTIDTSSLNPTYQLPLAPGISANRTTLLHFWQAGLTFTANGTLVNTTSPIAFYAAPSPPPADIPHSYVFYLFEQKAGFAPPPEDSPFSPDNVSKSPGNRRSFNVQGFTQEKGVGDLVAGNYFQVVNTTGSAGSSASASAGGGTTASATGSVTAPTAPSFTGAAVKAGIGAVGGSMMVAGFAMILLLG